MEVLYRKGINDVSGCVPLSFLKYVSTVFVLTAIKQFNMNSYRLLMAIIGSNNYSFK